MKTSPHTFSVPIIQGRKHVRFLEELKKQKNPMEINWPFEQPKKGVFLFNFILVAVEFNILRDEFHVAQGHNISSLIYLPYFLE